MKKCVFILAVLTLPVFCLAAGGGSDKSSKPFNWSLGLQNAKTGDLVSFSAPVESVTGDLYRLYVKPDSDCYLYVIYESPGGDDVAVLFSGAVKNGEVWISVDLLLTPPDGDESFFVITSRGEQKVLAERISALIANPGNTQRRALMNEVFRIRSEASQFKEAPEKPVLMGGVTRGDPDRSQGTEFSGLETYVKTISIQH